MSIENIIKVFIFVSFVLIQLIDWTTGSKLESRYLKIHYIELMHNYRCFFLQQIGKYLGTVGIIVVGEFAQGPSSPFPYINKLF